MKNIIFTISLTIACSVTAVTSETTSNCGLVKFECKNGECIDKHLVCDGHAHCKDESDETQEECQKSQIVCPKYAFRCAYGACIDGDLACNGIKDCVDNSDETSAKCGRTPSTEHASCSSLEFRCNNGQCIDKTKLCDGATHCADGSDETTVQCASATCSRFAFRCNYGACIDGDLKCNNIIDCTDGSDEDPKLCSRATSTESPVTLSSTSTPTPVTPIRKPTSCLVPRQPRNGYWKLHKSQCCPGAQHSQTCDHCDLQQGTYLERGAYLIYSCNPGYKLRGSAIVFCDPEGNWSDIPDCTEIRCKGLLSASTIARCSYNGDTVPCANPVLPRTVALLECQPNYRVDVTLLSTPKVTCNSNGQWEPEPIRCVPVCGVPSPDTVTLIVNGSNTNIHAFPWHATLYYAETPTAPKEFICGATIIRERLLVTAAHCIYNEVTKQANDPSKYYIVTGNIFKDYDTPFHNPIFVRKAKVKNIYINCNYYGLAGNHAADIAILEITQPFTITSTLKPICLDASNDPFVLEVGNYGKVAGFGKTAFGTSSAILQQITLPYVPLNVCKSTGANFGTVKYVTIDKFCAGYTNGSAVCDGDSGGGLVFEVDGLWYLKGIVSTSLRTKEEAGTVTCDSYSYSLYTRISNYMSWIQDVIFKVESKIPFPPCPTIFNQLL